MVLKLLSNSFLAGLIENAARSEITCPTCEGQGELADKPNTKHCPACGEPIGEDRDWCDEHREAAFIELKENI
jgi:predicted amidophosphoribosyltransferase